MNGLLLSFPVLMEFVSLLPKLTYMKTLIAFRSEVSEYLAFLQFLHENKITSGKTCYCFFKQYCLNIKKTVL
jgi:hypothetical protein